jgi:membrane complex biogenesis BtpA family protein
MKWVKELFGTEKPIVAMCHFRSLPGDPFYDNKKGAMDEVLAYAYQEMMDLQNGGVDAIMFSNEFSLPYLKKVRPITTATMARIIGELRKEIKVPYGVNVLWDPYAFWIWHSTGFLIRESEWCMPYFCFGPLTVERLPPQKEVCAADVRMLYNIVLSLHGILLPRYAASQDHQFQRQADVICVQNPAGRRPT